MGGSKKALKSRAQEKVEGEVRCGGRSMTNEGGKVLGDRGASCRVPRGQGSRKVFTRQGRKRTRVERQKK